jgi:hypothetical protein
MPMSQSAFAQAEEINPFECATCLGTQLIPYWVPAILVVFVVTMYMLHFHEKPFPSLEDEDSPSEVGRGA